MDDCGLNHCMCMASTHSHSLGAKRSAQDHTGMQTSTEIHPRPQQSGAMPATARPSQSDRLLRLADVRFMTGLGKSSIYASIQAGRFPSPVNLTEYAVAWHESEVATWIAQRPKVDAPLSTAPAANKSHTATAAPASRTPKTAKASTQANAPAARKPSQRSTPAACATATRKAAALPISTAKAKPAKPSSRNTGGRP